MTQTEPLNATAVPEDQNLYPSTPEGLQLRHLAISTDEFVILTGIVELAFASAISFGDFQAETGRQLDVDHVRCAGTRAGNRDFGSDADADDRGSGRG